MSSSLVTLAGILAAFAGLCIYIGTGNSCLGAATFAALGSINSAITAAAIHRK